MKLEIDEKHLNGLMRQGMAKLIERAGVAHFTDVKVRVNGRDEHYQADWIKHLKIVCD